MQIHISCLGSSISASFCINYVLSNFASLRFFHNSFHQYDQIKKVPITYLTRYLSAYEST